MQEMTQVSPQQQPTPVGCPPGLEYLAQLDQILVYQQIEIFEAMTGIKTRNKYQIKNSQGEQMYFAYEESNLCHRLMCKNTRGFTMHILDNFNREVIRIVRVFKCCSGCPWCADPGSQCSMKVQIESPPGQVIGYVKQAKSKWDPAYEIQDAHQQSVLSIKGPSCPCCQTICCTQDVDFNVMTQDGSLVIGRVAKQWGGFFREVITRGEITKADNFCVEFPADLDVKLKAVLIGATFLINCMFYMKEETLE